jgi:hypothetical protein
MSALGGIFGADCACLLGFPHICPGPNSIGAYCTAGRTDDKKTTLTTAPTMGRCTCGRAWVLGPCSSEHCLMLEPIAAVPRPDTPRVVRRHPRGVGRDSDAASAFRTVSRSALVSCERDSHRWPA